LSGSVFPGEVEESSGWKGSSSLLIQAGGCSGKRALTPPQQIAVGLELPLARRSALEYLLFLSGKKAVLL